MTETAQLAHVILPASSFLEKEGTFTSGERRVQRVNRVVEPDRLLEDAIATAAEIAFNPAESLRAIKRQAWENLTNVDIRRVMREEMREFVAAQRRPTFKEAVTAFREKRDPDFHKVEA